MGLFDLPVEKLLTYEGRNPRPHDFDAYWDKALAEMAALDPKPLLEKAPFEHPFLDSFHLTFTGTGGARIYAKYMRPKVMQGSLPAILCFHGYSGASECWTSLAAWAGAGFCVAAIDVRGQGGRSEDVGGVVGNTLQGQIIRGLDDKDPHKLLFRHIFLDTALLARVVSSFPEVDASRLAARGGSQGGGLTMACAALADIKAAAPVYPFLSDYQRVWEMDMAEDAYVELKQHFRRFDPTHSREEEIFTKLGYIDIQHLAPRIQGKVHMFTGLMDKICPPSTQFACYNKITSPKKVTFYPDFGHEHLPEMDDTVLQWFVKELKG